MCHIHLSPSHINTRTRARTQKDTHLISNCLRGIDMEFSEPIHANEHIEKYVYPLGTRLGYIFPTYNEMV